MNGPTIPSLDHVSGYHMAVVAGVVFFVIGALLALIPGLAGRHSRLRVRKPILAPAAEVMMEEIRNWCYSKRSRPDVQGGGHGR